MGQREQAMERPGLLGRGLQEEERGLEGGRGRRQEGYQEDALGYLLQGVDLIGGEPREVLSRGMTWSVYFLEFALVALTGGGRLRRAR